MRTYKLSSNYHLFDFSPDGRTDNAMHNRSLRLSGVKVS